MTKMATLNPTSFGAGAHPGTGRKGGPTGGVGGLKPTVRRLIRSKVSRVFRENVCCFKTSCENVKSLLGWFLKKICFMYFQIKAEKAQFEERKEQKNKSEQKEKKGQL